MARDLSPWYDLRDALAYDASSQGLAGKSLLWFVKAVLTGQIGAVPVGSRWTVVGSSDAVTAGLDGVDRWGTTEPPNLAKLVRASSGAHSWIVLRSPSVFGGGTGPYELLIRLNASSDTTLYAVALAKGSGAFTGGTPSAAPASASWYTGSASPAALAPSGATTAYRMGVTVAPDGSFYAIGAAQGNGWPSGMLAAVSLVDTPAGADFKASVGAWGYTTAPGAGAAISTAGLFGSAGAWRSATASQGLALQVWGAHGATQPLTAYGVSGDIVDGSAPRAPCVLIDTTLGGCRGRLADCFIGARALHGYTYLDGSGAVEYVQVQDLALPFNNVPLL